MIIYHNNRCRKSREALELVSKAEQEVEIREYLKEPLDREELKQLLSKLNLDPQEIIRTNEPAYKANFKGKNFGREEWIEILVENPKLIERPIIEIGNKAVIGRPIERVTEFLEN